MQLVVNGWSCLKFHRLAVLLVLPTLVFCSSFSALIFSYHLLQNIIDVLRSFILIPDSTRYLSFIYLNKSYRHSTEQILCPSMFLPFYFWFHSVNSAQSKDTVHPLMVRIHPYCPTVLHYCWGIVKPKFLSCEFLLRILLLKYQSTLFPCCPVFTQKKEKKNKISISSSQAVSLAIYKRPVASREATCFIPWVYWHFRNLWTSPSPLFIFSVIAFIFRREAGQVSRSTISIIFDGVWANQEEGCSHMCKSACISWHWY